VLQHASVDQILGSVTEAVRLADFRGIRAIGALLALAPLCAVACVDDPSCRVSRTCAPQAGGTAGMAGFSAGSGGTSEVGAGRGGEAGAVMGSGAGDAGQGGAHGGEAGEPAQTDAGAAGRTSPTDGGAGGEAGAGAGGEAGAEQPSGPDTTPPHIVQVEPADGATGVRADADIIVTFSEPMDRVATEIAYDSADLPPKDVTFSWSAGDRELTIHPDAELLYGGRVANIPKPRSYAYTIGGSACDKAGNQLGDDALLSFMMLNSLTNSLARASMYLVHHPSTGSDTVTAACASTDTSTTLGEETETVGLGVLVGFSTSALGEVLVPENLVAAKLTFQTDQSAGLLGDLVVDRVNEEPASATWDTPKRESLSATHSATSGVMPWSWEADARLGLIDDLQNRTDETTQYFIHFALPTNGDASIQLLQLRCAGLTLSATYLTE
jgi:hypothetical protein